MLPLRTEKQEESRVLAGFAVLSLVAIAMVKVSEDCCSDEAQEKEGEGSRSQGSEVCKKNKSWRRCATSTASPES
jgi:hypothetical protein